MSKARCEFCNKELDVNTAAYVHDEGEMYMVCPDYECQAAEKEMFNFLSRLKTL